MTVSSQTSRVDYAGDGVTAIFPVPFYFLEQSHLQVILSDDVTGAETVLVLNTDYTVTGAGVLAGGSITVPNEPAVGFTLTILRSVPVTQETDYVPNDPFPAESHERALDKLTMIIQQQSTDSAGAIRVAVSDPEPARLAPAVSRANQLMGFDSQGNPIAVAPVSGSAADLAMNLANATDPAKGAALVGYSGRTVYQALRDRVNAADYLIGGNTQTQAVQAAATAALAAGKALYIPGGEWLLTAAITGTGAPIAIIGDGVAMTRVVFTAVSGGFSFTFDPQGAGVIPDQFSISGMTIESRAAVTGPAIGAIWTTYQPNAQGMFWADDLNITRKADGTGSFSAGISLNRCIGGFVRGVVMVGDEARVSNYGIELVDCLEINFEAVKVTRYKEGAKISKSGATQTEGILFSNCWFFDLNRGINVVNQAIHINALGCFFNINGASAEYCISMTDVAQATISECLIYVGGNVGNPANQDGIRIANKNGNTICNNRFVAVTAANARYAVLFTGDASFNNVIGNSIAGFSDTGVRITAATSLSNALINNNFYDCVANIADAGTATFRSANLAIPALGNAIPIDTLRWGTAVGAFASGEISTNSQWGGHIRGYSGSEADLGFADSAGAVALTVKTGAIGIKSYAKAALPAAVLRNGGCGFIYVTDDVGGAVPAFSDGTNWRRVTDRAVIA